MDKDLSTPDAVAHSKELALHLEDFIASLRNNDCDDDYWKSVKSRIRSIIENCGFRFISDISASGVESYLAQRKAGGLGQRTVNHYLAAVKQFANWLVADRRTTENRLAYLKAGNAQLDVRRERRELNDDEIFRVMEATGIEKAICGLDGRQRFTLYAAALGTGLRASELARLTPTHFDLTANPPTVTILPQDSKSGRGDTLPMPADLVRHLSPFLSMMSSDARLWPGTWASSHNGCKLIQHDLRVAGVPYKTDEGQADFHALRHTYLSRLGRSGASPKSMQRLARHTTVELTLGKYTHVNLFDLASAVDKLPALPTGRRADDDQQALKATGTDDADPVLSPKDTLSETREPDKSVLPLCLPESSTSQGDSVHLNALSAVTKEPVLVGRRSNKKTRKARGKPHKSGKSGSGWESNPPSDVSVATPGLKPSVGKSEPTDSQQVTNSPNSVLPSHLPESLQNDADFARLMTAWAGLPGHIKAAVLALVDSAAPGD